MILIDLLHYPNSPKARSERDSSGTTEAHEVREGDGANSPTRGMRGAPLVRLHDEAARPNPPFI